MSKFSVGLLSFYCHIIILKSLQQLRDFYFFLVSVQLQTLCDRLDTRVTGQFANTFKYFFFLFVFFNIRLFS